jgi:hypothetical protein
MQYKLLALSALVTLAAATPTPRTTTPSDQCCTTVTTKDDPEAIKQAGLVNINISNVNVPIGLNCVPITVIGGGAAGWWVSFLLTVNTA